MTKEKRLIATNKTEEERDRLTEVWKKRIVSEKGWRTFQIENFLDWKPIVLT